MKKLLAFVITIIAMLFIATMTCYAVIDASTFDKPIDITDDVKYATLYDMYSQKLPVVRSDAQFIPSTAYTLMDGAATPGKEKRYITITDWAEKGMTSYFNNSADLSNGEFQFTAVWPKKKNVGDWDDRGRLVYNFNVAEAGTYELVFIGCARIQEAQVGNDVNDRGFSFSIDEGKISQVNISDTRGVFRSYEYAYSGSDLENGLRYTSDGVNSSFYEPTYYYGITVDLTAGDHTLEFYHLFYSGDTKFTSDAARINFMGFYVEKEYDYPQTAISAASLSLEDNVFIWFDMLFNRDKQAVDDYGMIFWKEQQLPRNYTYAYAKSCDSAIVKGQADGMWSYDEGINHDVVTYKYAVSAKQMADMVYAQAYVKVDGVYYYSDVIPYSVVTYASNKLGLTPGVTGTNDEKLKTLLRSMLEYGAASQLYFGYNTDNLANKILYEVSGTLPTTIYDRYMQLLTELRNNFLVTRASLYTEANYYELTNIFNNASYEIRRLTTADGIERLLAKTESKANAVPNIVSDAAAI